MTSKVIGGTNPEASGITLPRKLRFKEKSARKDAETQSLRKGAFTGFSLRFLCGFA
jgi:hypothetical protein